MPLQPSSTTAGIITTVVFGTCATIIGVVTIHQGRIAWRIWHEQRHRHGEEAASLGIYANQTSTHYKRGSNLLIKTSNLVIKRSMLRRNDPRLAQDRHSLKSHQTLPTALQSTLELQQALPTSHLSTLALLLGPTQTPSTFIVLFL